MSGSTYHFCGNFTGIAFYRHNFLKVSIEVHPCHFLEQTTENTFTVPKNMLKLQNCRPLFLEFN